MHTGPRAHTRTYTHMCVRVSWTAFRLQASWWLPDASSRSFGARQADATHAEMTSVGNLALVPFHITDSTRAPDQQVFVACSNAC